MEKRVFELEGKFWEVWRDGTTVFTRAGRDGEGAHTSTCTASTVEEADHVLEDRVRAQTKRGFVEAGAATVATGSPVDGAELATQIASLPALADDPAYLVFADWLQSHGDPWGELVAVQYNAHHATAKKRPALDRAAQALLDTLSDQLMGAGARHEHSRFVWHHGFLRTAVLGSLPDPAVMLAGLQALLAHPAASMIEGVVLNPVPAQFDVHRDWDESASNIVDPWTDLDAIAAALPAHVTHVGFGGWPAPAASAYLRMPSFSAISERFGRTRRLELTGEAPDAPGTFSLPALVDLEVRYAMASTAGLAALAESELPKLERFSVWLGGNAYCILDEIYEHEDGGYPDRFSGSDLEQLNVNDVTSGVGAGDVGELLDALPSTLQHLGIQSAPLDAEMIEAILARPSLARLATLDLSGGTLDDAAAKVLLGAKKQLGKVSLNLERNRIGAATAKKLAAAFPNAKLGGQRKKGSPPELFMRYVAVME